MNAILTGALNSKLEKWPSRVRYDAARPARDIGESGCTDAPVPGWQLVAASGDRYAGSDCAIETTLASELGRNGESSSVGVRDTRTNPRFVIARCSCSVSVVHTKPNFEGSMSMISTVSSSSSMSDTMPQCVSAASLWPMSTVQCANPTLNWTIMMVLGRRAFTCFRCASAAWKSETGIAQGAFALRRFWANGTTVTCRPKRSPKYARHIEPTSSTEVFAWQACSKGQRK
mmetsp:Transcript_25312/g.78136  ORF Transcript_25312/g.78136 Transcript_25312/m.78136 type:complete len:230 (+) Transcript_25312:1378-2067(+)